MTLAIRTTGGTYQIWALNEINMHGSFSGAQDEFESFFFALEAEVTEMGWRRLFDAAVTRDGPIKDAGQDSNDDHIFWCRKRL